MVTPVHLLASDQICFDKPVATKLLNDVIQKDTCVKNRDLLQQSVELYKIKSTELDKDKQEYLKERDQYKELYIKENKEKQKALEDKPSRLVWWTVGIGTAVVLGVLGAYTLK